MTNNYIADQNGFRSSLAPSNGPLLPLVGKAPKVSVSHAPVASKSNIKHLSFCLILMVLFVVAAAPVHVAPVPVASAPVHVAPVPVAATPTVKGESLHFL